MTIISNVDNNKKVNIKNIMQEKNIGINDLSRFSNIRIDKLQLYLNGEFGDLNDFLDLSSALGCDISKILDTDNYIKWIFETRVKEKNNFDRHSLDVTFVDKTCNILANYYHYFKYSEKKLSKSTYGEYPDHWNLFTAILDRIRDSSYYIKKANPHEIKRGLIALSFYDLLGHVYNLSSYINDLLNYFNVPIPSNDKHVIFTSTRSLTGNDDKYIKYLRSLVSSNHSIATSKHSDYIDKGDTHYSPFASWDSRVIDGVSYDINVVIRNNSETLYDYYISTTEIYKFIQMKLYSLLLVLEALELQVIKKRHCFSAIKLKNEDDFNEFYKYIEYLNNEHQIRIGNERPETYEFYSLLFKTKLNDDSFYHKDINIYKEVVKTEIKKRSIYLQTLKIEDYNELFDHLYIMYSDYINDNDLGYEIGHVSYLTDNVGSSIASRINAVTILNKIYNNKNKYEEYNNEELLIILNAALYKVSNINYNS